MMHTKFTVEDIEACWKYHKEYLVYILNGEYDLENAKEDLIGLIGSQYDSRINGIMGL